jgi:hypothetical protein
MNPKIVMSLDEFQGESPSKISIRPGVLWLPRHRSRRRGLLCNHPFWEVMCCVPRSDVEARVEDENRLQGCQNVLNALLRLPEVSSMNF